MSDHRFSNFESVIGVQGINRGPVHVHSHAPVGGTPQEKYDRGMEYLRSHDEQDALRLFKAAVEGNVQPANIHLRQMLAVVSRRSPTELHRERDLRILVSCYEAAKNVGRDAEVQAAEVVLDLVQEALDAGPHKEETGQDTATPTALTRLEALPPETRNEVRDHLVEFLANLDRNQADRELRHQMQRARTDGDREKRVPLFFLPDPIRPLHRPPAPHRASPWLRFGLATALAGLAAGVVLTQKVLFSANLEAALGVLLLWAVGGYTLARTAPGVAWRRKRARVPDPDIYGAGPNRLLDGRHREEISDMLATLVRHLAPASPADAGDRLMRDTLRLRTTLTEEITASCPPGIRSAGGLYWLLNAHTYDLVGRWSAGTLLAPREELRIRPGEWLLYLGATAALGFGSLWALAITFEAAAAAASGIWLLLIGTFWGTVTLGLRLDGKRRDQAACELAFQERASFEQRALAAYEKELRKRPTDPEMAAWLDGDLQRLRFEALDGYGLREEDVRDSFFLLDGEEGSLRARVHRCPTRYRHYAVRLFVVTSRGVRQTSWPLDFAIGQSGVEARRAFPHNAITSTRMTELRSPGFGSPGPERAKVHGLEFGLQLGADSGERIVIDYLDLLEQLSPGDLAEWCDLELYCSGVAKALRVLEAVAAEGEAWFARRRTQLASELKRLRRQDGVDGATA